MTGKKVHASSESDDVARLLGVTTDRMSSLTFFIARALSGPGGALIASTAPVGSGMGLTPILKLFIVAALGGLGGVFRGIVLGLGKN